MGANLLPKLLATGLILTLSSVSAAQTVRASSEGDRRISWFEGAMD